VDDISLEPLAGSLNIDEILGISGILEELALEKHQESFQNYKR
jgi:hypothetical protein